MMRRPMKVARRAVAAIAVRRSLSPKMGKNKIPEITPLMPARRIPIKIR
jgi:hypothetical protein